jgi:D-amino-acid oxidase
MVLFTTRLTWSTHCYHPLAPQVLRKRPLQFIAKKLSLSSGTANSSMDGKKVLVVGAGVIGLRTSLELLHRNVSVVLESARHPTHTTTCSMGAGGLWMPFHVNDPRVDRWAQETLDELLPIGNDETNDLVEIVPTVVSDFVKQGDYKSEPGHHTITTKFPNWTTMDDRIAFQHMTVEMLSWQNIIYRLRIPSQQELIDAGYLHAWMFRPPIVDAPKMLQHLLGQIIDHPNTISVNVDTAHEYESVQQLQDRAVELGCDTVVNCTGLGASKICQDNQVVGARGILLQYDRSTCVRLPSVGEGSHGNNIYDAVITTEAIWGSDTMPCYLIPRGDVVVVGGSYLQGDTELLIRDKERERLVRNATNMGIDVEQAKVVGEWTGFRPFRQTVRCEIEKNERSKDVKVVHSYGYGGSGWTLFVGAAKECADLVLT